MAGVSVVSSVETAFTLLIALQFAVIVAHDWLEIPGWTHGRQVQAVVGRGKLAIATAINAIFPGTALALALWFWRAPKPWYATDYWVAYCAVTVASAITCRTSSVPPRRRGATTRRCTRARDRSYRLAEIIRGRTCCTSASTRCLW